MQANRSWKLSFFTFWGAQAVSLLGSGLASFALVWWMTQETKSATVLATASMAGLLPGILFGPIAGALVDRWDRRWVMILSDALNALLAAILVVLFWSGAVELWHIYGIIALRSAAGTFQFPAVQSSTSLMVPDEQLSRVAGLNQSMQGFMMVATPPLGALLLNLLPLPLILALDVITAAIAIGLLFVIHIPQPTARPVSKESTLVTLWHDLSEGLRYIAHWPALVSILVLSMLLNLMLIPAFSLIPILVTRHFAGGAAQLGWINAAYGFGFLAGGILLGVWGGFKRRIYTSLLGLCGLGAGALLVSQAPPQSFWLGLTGMIIVGVMNPLANGPFFALLQSIVAPEMQGRVFTVMLSISMAMGPLGLAIAGPLADRLGVQVWYLLGGSVCLLMCIYMLLNPAIRNLDAKRRLDTSQPAS